MIAWSEDGLRQRRGIIIAAAIPAAIFENFCREVTKGGTPAMSDKKVSTSVRIASEIFVKTRTIAFEHITFMAEVQNGQTVSNYARGLRCPNCLGRVQRLNTHDLHCLKGVPGSPACCVEPVKLFSSEQQMDEWESKGWRYFQEVWCSPVPKLRQ